LADTAAGWNGQVWSQALAAELQIKNWSRAKKRALANGDFGALKAAARKKDGAADRQRRQRL